MQRMIIVVAAVVVSAGLVWALTVTTKFPKKATARISGIVDEAGNLLFGDVPANVAVTNFPAAPSGATDVVTLARSNSPCASLPSARALDTALNGDGSATTGFAVPAGRVLVVTAVEFAAVGTVPGAVADFRLIVTNGTSTVEPFVVVGTLEPSGVLTKALTFPNGIVVRPGATVCAQAVNTSNATLLDAQVRAHGYLAADG